MRNHVKLLGICVVLVCGVGRVIAGDDARLPVEQPRTRTDLMTLRVGVTAGDLIGDSNAIIQRAVDIVAGNGGGTVELGRGVYTCSGSVRMKSGVKLVGAGPETILRRCVGPTSPIIIEADFGETEVTVADPTGFRVGMDIAVMCGDQNSRYDSPATVTLIKGKTLYLDRRLIWDYPVRENIEVLNAFPLISFTGLYAAGVENLCVDGNRKANHDLGSWNLPGILITESRFCRVANCLVKDLASDGITCAITKDITIEGCEMVRNKYFGIHLGSGSTGAIVLDNSCEGNGLDGLYLCWRVQQGRFENNKLSGNEHSGISIGHKDTDNLFTGNTARGNKRHGVYFRPGPLRTTGNRNTFRKNTIQDNGDCGVFIEGETANLVFEDNLIGDTRRESQRTQRVGIRAATGTSGIRCQGNKIENHIVAATEGEIESLK